MSDYISSIEFITGIRCPSEFCKMCNGEACNKCGAGCWYHGIPSPPCEHDCDERHEQADLSLLNPENYG